jgi:hypothetical protein
MARVERFISQGEIPVQQAVLAGDFAADTSSAEALQAGADLANVFAELAKRKQEAQDSLAATKASKSRTFAELKMQQFMADNPDPDTWNDGFSKIYAEQANIYNSQKQSAEARKKQDVEQQAFRDQLQAKVMLAATNQEIKNDVFESGANVIDLMSTDDGSPQHALEESQAIERYKAALEREMTPEMATIKMEETLKEGQKAFYINQSKLDPDGTIALMEKKKKALGKGGKDKDGLTAKDMDDIIGSAHTAKALAEKSLDAQQEIELEEVSTAMQSGRTEDGEQISWSYIQSKTSLTSAQKETARQRMNLEAKRLADGIVIATDERKKHNLLDLAAAINWPDRDITAAQVKEMANEGRLGPTPYLDDTAYSQVRDAIRKAEEDKIPFTEQYTEKIIGELITGAPSSVLGLPLPTLRTRDDAIKHATNSFGRFIDRVPGVMATINAKWPPPKSAELPVEPEGTPAHDFDGELIGGYNPDGSITLNNEGVRRLLELAGGDKEKAREMARQNRYVLPP